MPKDGESTLVEWSEASGSVVRKYFGFVNRAEVRFLATAPLGASMVHSHMRRDSQFD